MRINTSYMEKETKNSERLEAELQTAFTRKIC